MACPRTARSPFPIAPAPFSRSRGRASDEAKPARGRGETPPGIFPRNVGFQGFASRALFPTSPTGDRRRFQFCIERFQGLRRLFLQLSNFVILAVRQPEPRTVSCPPVYQILWVRGFRAHTIPGRGFNLFKPLRRHFRATPFCRQALSRRDPSDRRSGVTQLFAAILAFFAGPFEDVCMISIGYRILQSSLPQSRNSPTLVPRTGREKACALPTETDRSEKL